VARQEEKRGKISSRNVNKNIIWVNIRAGVIRAKYGRQFGQWRLRKGTHEFRRHVSEFFPHFPVLLIAPSRNRNVIQDFHCHLPAREARRHASGSVRTSVGVSRSGRARFPLPPCRAALCFFFLPFLEPADVTRATSAGAYVHAHRFRHRCVRDRDIRES